MQTGELYSQCRACMLEGVIDALDGSKAYFDSIQRNARGEIPVNALVLDVFPWHSAASLSLRTRSVPTADRYAIADWPNFDFANQATSSRLRAAADFAGKCYREKAEDLSSIEVAHMIFMAAAEALLDPSVAEQLQSDGIDAPYIGSGIGGHSFEYLVLDPDNTCRANYCDIIRANRTSERLRGIIWGAQP